VGWDLSCCGVAWLGVFDLSQGEVTTQLAFKEFLGELVYAFDIEVTTVGVNVAAWHDFVICQIVISHETKTWLGDCKAVRNLPTLKKKSKVVTAIIRCVDLSNLNCVIRKVIVNDERKIIPSCVETKNFAIIVQELLFRWHTTASKRLFHELFKVIGLLYLRLFLHGLGKIIHGEILSRRLRLLLQFKELTSVLITVIQFDLFAENHNFLSNAEIKRHHSKSTAVLPEELTSLQEIPLWHTTVSFFGLNNHHCVVLKVIHNDQLSKTVVFKSAFNNCLFKVSEESQNLLFILRKLRKCVE